MIELVTLSSEDWSLWRDLRLRALAEAPYAFGSTLVAWENAPEERWRERLDLPDALNVIAKIDDEAVGMATGASFDGTLELISMWVAPEARGRGVGDALIVRISRWARERGATELRLAVVAHNANAVRLYLRHGFVDVGPSDEVGERAMSKPL